MEHYIAAIDVGTTGAKAMIIGTDGSVAGQGYREYGAAYPRPGWVEQDSEEIVEKTFEACRRAVEAAAVDPSQLACASFSCQRSTFGFLDDEMRMIDRRLYGWQDQRAAETIDETAGRIDPGELYRISGMPVSPPFAIHKLVWILKNDPDTYRRARWIVHLGDYVSYRFGAGELRAELTAACTLGLVDFAARGWSDRILTATGIDRAKLPPLVESGARIGSVSAAAAARSGLPEGLPLIAGSGDQQCAAIGAGVVSDGMASLTLGTSGFLVAGAQSLDLSKTAGLMAPLSPAFGICELEANQLGAASAYRWARDVLAETECARAEDTGTDAYRLMDIRAEQSPPGSNGVVFLPHLTGSGYPNWDPDARGVFAGLTFSSTKNDLLRAVMEGITLEAKDMYETMRESGVSIRSLAITGGATKSRLWRQIIADMFATEVKVLAVADATLVGAAIIGAVGAGLFADVREGAREMVHISHTVLPIPENAETYRRLHRVYREVYASLRGGAFRQLSSL